MLQHKPYDLTVERSLVNAKLRLLGSKSVRLAYHDAANKLQDGSRRYVAASPRRTELGNQTVVLFESPDATEKYKTPTKEAHEVLHAAVTRLRGHMQSNLRDC